jgi:hypothetical protein
MTAHRLPIPDFERRIMKYSYLALLFFMALTGLAQMPIFKRYYIADVPGLGWLAQFYTTHTMHYLGAIAFLALLAYGAILYGGVLRRIFIPTRCTIVRVLFLTGIVVTGILRTLKNLPDVVFSPGLTMAIDISHLGFMMALASVGTYAMMVKCRWLKRRQ